MSRTGGIVEGIWTEGNVKHMLERESDATSPREHMLLGNLCLTLLTPFHSLWQLWSVRIPQIQLLTS